MKKIHLAMAVLAVAGVANAADIPSGVTGLWRMQDNANKYAATIGTALTSTVDNGAFLGPWTMIGVTGNAGLYADGGVIQTLTGNYFTVTDGIAPNGGGAFVNEYTVSIDYVQTTELTYNSLFQTAAGNGNDGEIFITGPNRANSVIGVAATGYSTLTFDASTWHRITWSVDNGSFYRIYVDGNLYLDGTPQPVDGRFSLDPTFLLLADNDGEVAWGLLGTAIVWDHALTTAEIAGMGGWIGGSPTPTDLTLIPEPGTLSLLAVGGLFGLIRRVRK